MDYKHKYLQLKGKHETLLKLSEKYSEELSTYRKQIHQIRQQNNYLLDCLSKNDPTLCVDSTDSSDLSDYEPYPTGPITIERQQESLGTSTQKPFNKGASSLSDESTKRRRQLKKRESRDDAKPVEKLPRDSNGNVILPVVVGKGNDEVTIVNIGHIISNREAYHTQRYIWPVGFKSKKVYASLLAPGKKNTYVNEILENGDSPIFQITIEEEPTKKFTSSSASGVWKIVLDKIAEKGYGAKSHASGPQMMGLNNLALVNYIQDLPNADKCSKYVRQKWLPSTESKNENSNYQESPIKKEISIIEPKKQSTLSFNSNQNQIVENKNLKRLKLNANSPLSNILNDEEYEQDNAMSSVYDSPRLSSP